MNETFATTGLEAMTVGSTKIFQVQPWLNGLPWDLTGGSARLVLSDPDGINTTLTASIVNGGAQVSWTVPLPAGSWLRAWDLTDASGRRQISLPIAFTVVSSPK